MNSTKKPVDDIQEVIQKEIEAEVQPPDIGKLIEAEIKADMRPVGQKGE